MFNPAERKEELGKPNDINSGDEEKESEVREFLE